MSQREKSLDRELERRLDNIEGWQRVTAMTILGGAAAMATATFWLAGRINTQNGRVTANERRTYAAQNDLRVVKWVGATFMAIALPVVVALLIDVFVTGG